MKKVEKKKNVLILKKNSDKFSVFKRVGIRERMIQRLDSYGKEFLTRQALEGEYAGFDEPDDSNGNRILDIDKLETVISYLGRTEPLSHNSHAVMVSSSRCADANCLQKVIVCTTFQRRWLAEITQLVE